MTIDPTVRRTMATLALVMGALVTSAAPAAATPGAQPRLTATVPAAAARAHPQPATAPAGKAGHAQKAAFEGTRVAAASANQTVSPAGQTAVAFALSQVGKPYAYGAVGPSAYDCSGLAMVAWAAAGVHLPRTAAEQYLSGAHVPLGQLEPGDLVFWAYNPADPSTIHHVAISLGGERTVQATQTGEKVQVINIWASGLVPLATRPG